MWKMFILEKLINLFHKKVICHYVKLSKIKEMRIFTSHLIRELFYKKSTISFLIQEKTVSFSHSQKTRFLKNIYTNYISNNAKNTRSISHISYTICRV